MYIGMRPVGIGLILARSSTTAQQRTMPLWWWIVPLLLLTTWLGTRGLTADALWYDEVNTIHDIGAAQYGPVSALALWGRISEESPWPPAYYYLMAGWGALTGWTAFTGRAFSLFIGILSIAWMYRLGRDMTTPLVGLSAAVVLGMSAFFIIYLHEFRGYTLYVLLTIIVVWAYWRLITLRHEPSRALQATFVLSVAGVFYVHYFAGLTAVAIGLYHLLFVPKNTRWWRVAILLGIGGLLFLPWLTGLSEDLERAGRESRNIAVISTDAILRGIIDRFSNGTAALLAIIAFAALRVRGRVVGFAWLWLIAVLLLSLAANEQLRIITHVRYMLALWPVLALLAALGIMRLSQSGIRLSWILGIWIAAGLWLTLQPTFASHIRTPAFRAVPFDAMVAVLDERAVPNDAIALHAGDFAWAVAPSYEHYLFNLDVPVRHIIMEELPGRAVDDEYLRSARNFIADAPHVWVVIDETMPTNFRLAEFERALADDYVLCETVIDDDLMRMTLYTRIPDDTNNMLQFDDVLLNIAQPVTLTDDRLNVTLGFTVDEAFPAASYSVAVHVEDAAGNLVAQTDYGLPSELFACRASHIDIAHLPPGEYTVLTTVYNWQDGTRLLGVAPNGSRGERLLLDSFMVTR